VDLRCDHSLQRTVLRLARFPYVVRPGRNEVVGEKREIMTSDSRPSGPLLPWLQLIRIPTVFTAMADIFLGFILVKGTFDPVDEFIPLIGISVCLYWTGMILNDYFDRAIDAEQRPGRPIPSGRISAQVALGVAIFLNATGLAIAFSLSQNTLIVAGALSACVWLYDGALKKTPLAPVFMGGCRFFNVMLGASMSSTGALWCLPVVMVASGLGIYIAGLTWFARTEAATSSKRVLWAATAIVNSGIAILLLTIVSMPEKPHVQWILMAMGVVTVTIQRRLAKAIHNPTPAFVQTAIKTMLLSLVMFDAIIVLYVTAPTTTYAAATAALMIPALVLSRFIPMT
jgi:4-hydroxybenzoate polyprenyltransferase